jgi:DNA-directed RNA polymerase specialized sigma24 family protein
LGVGMRMVSVMEMPNFTQRAAIDASDSAAAVSRALAALSGADLLRLQALARLRAHGLPQGLGWADLLHEALARALDGSRQWPAGVPLLVFLAGVMRSLCDEIWRRRRREAEVVTYEEAAGRTVACPAPDQERVVAAGEALAVIYRLFAGDQTALLIISGLAGGLSAEDIRAQHGLSSLVYDSARRRMRRALLRAGLCGGTP